MRKAKKEPDKLAVKKETLRKLDAEEQEKLKEVVGGADTALDDSLDCVK
jgi:hypothetical protein